MSKRTSVIIVTIGLLMASVMYLYWMVPKTKRIRVEHYLYPVTGVGSMLTMVVDDGHGPEWLYQGIEGFTYSWGTRYELTIRVEKVPHPPADGSSVRYILVSVDKQERVPAGTRFTIVLSDPDYIRDEALVGERKFTYASDEIHLAFKRHLAVLAKDYTRFKAEFSHPNDPSQPLVLVGVADFK
jgi:hypothetical protein